MARLTLSLLGPFQAALDGQPITTFESDKARALLAYLAVEHGRPQPREKLAGLLWGNWPEATARNNLSHALTNLRHATGEGSAESPIFLVSRQVIQFSRESDAFVDAAAFTDLMGRRDLLSMEQAVELYHGRFLEGFSLPDSSAFEEWQLLEQEHLHRLAMRALGQLAVEHEGEGDPDRALHFAQRQLELEPWWESAHQQVMRLMARSGQRDAALAQYQACRRLLAQELGAEPSADTNRLYAEIRDGALEPDPVRKASDRGQATPPSPLPGFLVTGRAHPTRPVFVAREQELARLEGFLEVALAGRGQAAFVIGGAGRGKTALLGEFARRALDAHPDMLLAIGTCDAYAGVGGPYFPFRQALGMLSGDAEAQWAAGTLSTEHARRLWAVLPEVAAILADRGSELVGTFLPGRDLLARVRAAAPSDSAWLERLECLADPSRTAPGGLEQSHLLEQYANVLLDLSVRHPLLLVLDDLQWADLASVSLLFYLGRRIGSGRILIVGAYRADEVALGRDAERHPLEPTLAELRRSFGDVWLDLAAVDDAESRNFVDQYLDAQPNALDEAFRRALSRRTGGHPLFTIELLRDMKGRGDLVLDEQGRWREGAALDWGILPARAEAAIAERIARLPQSLRDILAVASVEGEEFTAQAVARVQGVDELQLARTLHRELASRHRLVRAQGELQVGERYLARYRFAHFLFQQHIYCSLGEGERRLLHRRVGGALEQLYEGHLKEIAAHLARHYAGDGEHERRYLKMAGERAAAQYANEEAVGYFTGALLLTPEEDAVARFDLLLLREQVYDRQGQRALQSVDLQAMTALAKDLADSERHAEAALRRSAYLEAISDYSAAGVAAQDALTWADQADDPLRQATARLRWGEALLKLPDYPAAQAQLHQALALAHEACAQQVELSILARLGEIAFWRESDRAGALEYGQRALRIACEIGDRRGEGVALEFLATLAWCGGDNRGAMREYERLLKLTEEIGDRRGEAAALRRLGDVLMVTGSCSAAQTHYERALRLCRDIGNQSGEVASLGRLGWCAGAQGDFGHASSLGQQALHLAREIGDGYQKVVALIRLGRVAQSQGAYAEARGLYEQAQREAQTSGLSDLEVDLQNALGAVLCSQGECDRAKAHCEQALALARGMGDVPGESLALSKLGRALLGLGRPSEAAVAFRKAAELLRQQGWINHVAENEAGLAAARLAEGDLPSARDEVEKVLRHLESGNLDGADEPLREYLTCYRVLHAAGDPRAPRILDEAHSLLMARASRILDEAMRRSYLENVAEHLEIVAEFARLSGPQ